MSDVNIIEEYRALMAIVVNEEMTDDDRLMLIKLLAEMRAGYQAGMWAEEKVTGVEQAKPDKGRLVWGQTGSIRYLAPSGEDQDGAYYSTGGTRALRYPGGVLDYDRSEVVSSLAHGLRVITDLARADGYECDDHPDAAPAIADALTLPPSR